MAGVRKEGEGDFRSAKSGLGTSPLSAWMREAHAVRLRAVSFFLVPRAKCAGHENGLAKSEEKGRLLAVYTSRTREAWQKGARRVMGRRRTKGRESPLFNRRPRDNWGQVSPTNSHSTADETQGVTRPCLLDQRFSI